MSCRKCWSSKSRPIEVATDGNVVAFGDLCDACFDKALAGANALRDEFEALLAAGVSRETANEHLIAKIRGKESA